jgi:hypothetical protein
MFSTQNLLFLALATFFMIYFMSTLLMTGYLHIKNKFSSAVFKQMLRDFLKIFFSFQAITQRRLDPKGYDYKLYVRFQRRYILYYFSLWILLFAILFLAAKKYLNAF